MNGYVTIPRFIFDDPGYLGRGIKFSKPSALIDLIQLARISDGKEFVNGRYVDVKRGQLCKSVRELSARWGWDEKTVSKFLNSLTQSEIIAYDFPHSKCGLTRIISIVSYDNWCEDSHTDSHTDSATTPTLIPTQSSSTNVEYDRKQENKNKEKNIQKKKDSASAVERLYQLYPSSVVRANGSRSSLKSGKDKDKLLRLLTKHSEEELANTIKRYLSENPGAYTKMFSTFLNNLPDYSDDGAVVDAQPELPLYDQIRNKANKPQSA